MSYTRTMETVLRSAFFLLLSAALVRCFVTNTTAEQALSGKDINGTRLLELGNVFNISVLKLIGKAFENMDERFNSKLCEMRPCSHWTRWADCSAVRASQFGAQTRTRTCWRDNSKPCANDGEAIVENDSRVCEGYCPDNYNITSNKYCLIFNSTKVNQSTAEKRCQADGGHLINIDTEERWTEFLTFVSVKNQIWIDGLRTSRGGKWNYLSGQDPEDNGVAHFGTSQPSNAKYELCKSTHIVSGKLHWYDGPCSSVYHSVCEVRPNM